MSARLTVLVDTDRPDFGLRRNDRLVVDKPGWVDDGLYVFSVKSGLQWGTPGLSWFQLTGSKGRPLAWAVATDLEMKFKVADEGAAYRVAKVQSVIRNGKPAAVTMRA